jgi:hypothetical protein
MQKFRRRIAMIPTAATLLIFGSACGHGAPTDEESPTIRAHSSPKAVRAPERENLLTTMKKVSNAGQADFYTACFEVAVPKLQAVDLYAVPTGEKCPSRLHGDAPPPSVPDFVGKRIQNSLIRALTTGYYPKRTKVFKDPDFSKGAVPPKPLANWTVCGQQPQAGTVFRAMDTIKLYAAKDCTA